LWGYQGRHRVAYQRRRASFHRHCDGRQKTPREVDPFPAIIEEGNFGFVAEDDIGGSRKAGRRETFDLDYLRLQGELNNFGTGVA
jgi:hypothetical protein